MPEGILHQGDVEKTDFLQNLCILKQEYNVSMEGTEYSATVIFMVF